MTTNDAAQEQPAQNVWDEAEARLDEHARRRKANQEQPAQDVDALIAKVNDMNVWSDVATALYNGREPALLHDVAARLAALRDQVAELTRDNERMKKRESLYTDPTCAVFMRPNNEGSEHACVRYKRELADQQGEIERARGMLADCRPYLVSLEARLHPCPLKDGTHSLRNQIDATLQTRGTPAGDAAIAAAKPKEQT